jgi:hypothetical protein
MLVLLRLGILSYSWYKFWNLGWLLASAYSRLFVVKQNYNFFMCVNARVWLFFYLSSQLLRMCSHFISLVFLVVRQEMIAFWMCSIDTLIERSRDPLVSNYGKIKFQEFLLSIVSSLIYLCSGSFPSLLYSCDVFQICDIGWNSSEDWFFWTFHNGCKQWNSGPGDKEASMSLHNESQYLQFF